MSGLLPRASIVELERPGGSYGREPRAIGAKLQGAQRLDSLDDEVLLTNPNVVHAHDKVTAEDSDACSVWTEHRRVTRGRSLQRKNLLPAQHVVQAHHRVFSLGGDPPSIWTEDRIGTRKGEHFQSRLRIAHNNSGV